MVPAQVHQTGMKTERMWKNYYRKGDVSEAGNVVEDVRNNINDDDLLKNSRRAHCNGETRSGYAVASFPRCNAENQRLKQNPENNHVNL